MESFTGNQFTAITRLYKQISLKRKRQLLGSLILMISSGMAEAYIISSFSFLLSSFSNKLSSDNSDILISQAIDSKIQLPNINSNILFFGIAILITGILRVSTIRITSFVPALIANDLSHKIITKLLYRNYDEHIRSNTSVLINKATQQLNTTIDCIGLTMVMINNSVLASGIFIAILFLSWKVTLVISFTLIILYFLIYKNISPKLKTSGFDITASRRKQIKIVREALSGMSEIILSNTQRKYIKEYTSNDKRLRFAVADGSFKAIYPRYALEAIFLMLALIIFSLIIITNKNPELILIGMGTGALAAQRLLPAIQQVYAGFAEFALYSVSIEDVLEILELKDNNFKNNKKISSLNFNKEISFNNSISLKNISYRHLDSESDVIKSINFRIKKGDKIGIIGKTGSGKSTLKDILSGLIKPTSGNLIIDGVDLHSKEINIKEWFSLVSVVSQNEHIFEGSLLDNIICSDEEIKLDNDFIKEILNKSSLDTFVNSLPKGVNSFIGERGFNLSGGQSQRIVIARALYKKSQLLILDEATSALDIETERKIIDGIYKKNKDLTIISIAHRKEALKYCNKIIELSNGSIINEINRDDFN